MDKTKVYSPRQASMATFIGGPLAGVYVLQKNMKAFGRHAQAKQTVVWGVLGAIAYFVLAEIVSGLLKGPGVGIGFALGSVFAVEKYVADYQMTKQAIAGSDDYAFQSGWNVLAVGICSILVTVAGFVLWLVLAQVFRKFS